MDNGTINVGSATNRTKSFIFLQLLKRTYIHEPVRMILGRLKSTVITETVLFLASSFALLLLASNSCFCFCLQTVFGRRFDCCFCYLYSLFLILFVFCCSVVVL